MQDNCRWHRGQGGACRERQGTHSARHPPSGPAAPPQPPLAIAVSPPNASSHWEPETWGHRRRSHTTYENTSVHSGPGIHQTLKAHGHTATQPRATNVQVSVSLQPDTCHVKMHRHTHSHTRVDTCACMPKRAHTGTCACTNVTGLPPASSPPQEEVPRAWTSPPCTKPRLVLSRRTVHTC